jgi:hypothetical protein
MKKHRLWTALLLVPALLLLASSGVFAQGTQLVVSDGSALHGDTDTVTISLNNVTNVGAVDLDLSFDENVVLQTGSISWGDFGAADAHTINNSTGMIEMNWFSLGGQTGDFTLCTITFEAIGNYPECSDLELTFTDVVDVAGPPIEHTTVDGEFCVLEGDEPAPAVGGIGQLPSIATLLAPWIAGGSGVGVAIGLFVRRRRKNH